MQLVKLVPIEHKGNQRLLVQFPYDFKIISILKKIEGATWSRTHKSWHVPNDKLSLDKIFELFKDIAEVDASLVNSHQSIDNVRQPAVANQKKEVIGNQATDGVTPSHPVSLHKGEWGNDRIRIEVSGKKIFVKMPKNVEDVSFINSLKYARFNKTNFMWEVPNYKNNLQIIKEYFGTRITEVKVNSQPSLVNSQKTVAGNDAAPAKQKPNTVMIEIVDNKIILMRFPFSKEHVARIKNIPYYYWHNEGKYWSFPYTENILSELESYFKQFNYAIESKHTSAKDKGNKEKKNYGNDRKMPPEYIEKLKLVRYSENTVRTYTQAFSDFINYYASKELNDINRR